MVLGTEQTTALPRVLIVDDDPDVVDLVVMNLTLSGHEVESAGDGAAGLAKARSGKYDLIILDMSMPKLNGLQVCEQLRYNPATRAVPVIFLTAKGMTRDKVSAFNTGGDDYLVKPFDPQELEVRIRALLRRVGAGMPTHQTLAEILEAGDIQLRPESLQTQMGERLSTLTPTEFEIVHCLLQHTDQPVSHAVLLNEVWGFEADENVDMLRVHMRHLRQKLEPDPQQPRYLLTVPHVGYRLAVLRQPAEVPGNGNGNGSHGAAAAGEERR